MPSSQKAKTSQAIHQRAQGHHEETSPQDGKPGGRGALDPQKPSPQPQPQQHDTLRTQTGVRVWAAIRECPPRRRSGRFWHGFRRAAAACMDAGLGLHALATADAFGAFSGQSVQRKWPTRPMTSNACCHRRTLLALAGCRGGRSIERLHGASCERRGSAIGFASTPRSSSAGSPRKRAGRPRRLRRDLGVTRTAFGAGCVSCSMRARKARGGCQ